MKCVLLSGSLKGIEIPYDVVSFIKDNLVGGCKISFVACDFDSYDRNDRFVNKLLNEFNDKDLFFDNVFLIDSRMLKDDMVDKLKISNIVFLLGGDTLKQIKFININC